VETSTEEPRVEWDVAETGALTPAEKLHIALELFESGVAMMREKLKREYPSESAERIEERLRAWIQNRQEQRTATAWAGGSIRKRASRGSVETCLPNPYIPYNNLTARP
jgi:hypothetical protein